VYGGLLGLLSMAVFGAPGVVLLALDDQGSTTQVLGILLIAVGVYLASFSVVYFNVALAAAANDALAGQDPDVAAVRAVHVAASA
jgi:hypothetical protein